jgi:hypothetical protein
LISNLDIVQFIVILTIGTKNIYINNLSNSGNPAPAFSNFIS